MKIETGWTTAKEMEFIDRLGRHSAVGHDVGRRALLHGYVQSLPQRECWGELRADYVAAYARLALLNAL